MQPPIFPVCAGAAPVTALLGTAPTRLYPFGEAPQGTPLPYAVHQVISGAPENYLGDRPDTDSSTLQVDVYALTASDASEVAKAIQDALELDAHVVRYGARLRDPETRSYRVSFDVSWIVRR